MPGLPGSVKMGCRFHPSAHRVPRLSLVKTGSLDRGAAMNLEESLQRLEEQIELLKRKVDGRDDAYHKGFTEGVCMALLMLRSRAPVDRTGKRTQSTAPSSSAAPKRDQLDLF